MTTTRQDFSQRLWTLVFGVGLTAYAGIFLVEGIGSYI